MMHCVVIILAMLLPQTALAQDVTRAVAGDWGIETSPDLNCATNPLRIALQDKDGKIEFTMPAAAIALEGFAPVVVTATIVTVDGNTIIMHHDGSKQSYFIIVSDDRMSLRTGRLHTDPQAQEGITYTRCADAVPAS